MKKRRRRRNLVVFLGTFLLTLFLASCKSTEEPNIVEIVMPEVKEDTYVYDQGNILGEEVKEEMNQLAIDLEEKKGVEFVIITVDSLEKLKIDDYVYTLVNKLGIGKEKGVLLFISKNDNQVKLEVGKGLTECLNNKVVTKTLQEHFEPFQKLEHYDTATKLTSHEIVKEIMGNERKEKSTLRYVLEITICILFILAVLSSTIIKIGLIKRLT